MTGPIIDDSRRAHRVGSGRRDVAFFEAKLRTVEQVRLIIIGATLGVVVGILAVLTGDGIRVAIVSAVAGSVLLGFTFAAQRLPPAPRPSFGGAPVGQVALTLGCIAVVLFAANVLFSGGEPVQQIHRAGASGTGPTLPAVASPASASVAPANSAPPQLASQQPPDTTGPVTPAQRPQASSGPTAPGSFPAATDARAPTPTPTIAVSPTPAVPAASSVATPPATVPSPQPTPTSAPTSLIPTLPPLPTLPLPTLPTLP